MHNLTLCYRPEKRRCIIHVNKITYDTIWIAVKASYRRQFHYFRKCDYLFLKILVVNNCCLSLSVTIAQLKIDWDIGEVLEFLQISEWEACIIKEQPWCSGSGLSPGKPGFDSAGIHATVFSGGIGSKLLSCTP